MPGPYLPQGVRAEVADNSQVVAFLSGHLGFPFPRPASEALQVADH